MMGGYTQDHHLNNLQLDTHPYRFYNWHLIDIFIYFSHHLITIPTASYINICHNF